MAGSIRHSKDDVTINIKTTTMKDNSKEKKERLEQLMNETYNKKKSEKTPKIKISKEFHLNRAKEFDDELKSDKKMTSTERATLERLRDQRLALAEKADKYAKGATIIGGLVDSRKEYKDVHYKIMYKAPKGYYISAEDAKSKKIFTNHPFFDKSSEAEQHAEMEIEGYLDSYAKGTTVTAERQKEIAERKKMKAHSFKKGDNIVTKSIGENAGKKGVITRAIGRRAYAVELTDGSIHTLQANEIRLYAEKGIAVEKETKKIKAHHIATGSDNNKLYRGDDGLLYAEIKDSMYLITFDENNPHILADNVEIEENKNNLDMTDDEMSLMSNIVNRYGSKDESSANITEARAKELISKVNSESLSDEGKIVFETLREKIK